MSNWLEAAASMDEPAVLVTVAAVEGSAPRAAGTSMLVSRTRLVDTIGGGHLEYRATELAHELLASPGAQRKMERLPLGPSLGQCCGGVVWLLLEKLEPAARQHFSLLLQRRKQRLQSWRLIPLAGDQPAMIAGEDGRGPDRHSPLPLQPDAALPCEIRTDDAGQRWLLVSLPANRPQLFLFGAGHVGRALVRVLADLPCDVTWTDEREELFPAEAPANVSIEVTDMPEAVVAQAPAGASFLVMTHSHALDQRLAEHILRRGDAGWFGLIGSRTKRMQFEHRLRERGIPEQRLACMVCPIGLPGISGKEPAVIAVAVAAQLLQVWQAATDSRPLQAQAQH